MNGSRMGRVFDGAFAGKVGTAAMTLLMEPGLGGRLPRRWRPDEFVPKQIVEWAESVAGRPGALSEPAAYAAAFAAHFGYGATMGVLYGMARWRLGGRLPPAAAGAAWGALVWAFGYQGWLPALGVRPATTAHPPAQWPLPIANHLLFGVVTALVYARLREG